MAKRRRSAWPYPCCGQERAFQRQSFGFPRNTAVLECRETKVCMRKVIAALRNVCELCVSCCCIAVTFFSLLLEADPPNLMWILLADTDSAFVKAYVWFKLRHKVAPLCYSNCQTFLEQFPLYSMPICLGGCQDDDRVQYRLHAASWQEGMISPARN